MKIVPFTANLSYLLATFEHHAPKFPNRQLIRTNIQRVRDSVTDDQSDEIRDLQALVNKNVGEVTKLEGILRKLVTLYIANMNRDGEFIQCMSSVSRTTAYHNSRVYEVWQAWQDAKDAVIPKPDTAVMPADISERASKWVKKYANNEHGGSLAELVADAIAEDRAEYKVEVEAKVNGENEVFKDIPFTHEEKEQDKGDDYLPESKQYLDERRMYWQHEACQQNERAEAAETRAGRAEKRLDIAERDIKDAHANFIAAWDEGPGDNASTALINSWLKRIMNPAAQRARDAFLNGTKK